MATTHRRASLGPKLLSFADCARLWPLVIAHTPPGVDLDLAYRIEELIARKGWEPGHITLEAMRRLCAEAVCRIGADQEDVS